METVIKREPEEDSAVPHNNVQVKLERADHETQAELLYELYRDHEIKEEMVTGPVVLHKPGSSTEPVLQDVTANSSVLKRVSHCRLCGQDIHSSSSNLTQHNCTRASNTSSCDLEEQGEHIATTLTCDVCKRDFKWKKTLIDKSEILFVTCKICCKQFTASSTLTRHYRIHTGDKPYFCKDCKKQFSDSSNLNQHRLVHSGEKTYFCEICNKKFSRSSHLVSHRRVHSGFRPHSCKICNRQFSQSSSLTSHHRTHTGDKPYSCNICNKQFTQSSNLTRHHRVHTGDKPYWCKVCSKQFSDKYYLKKHERTHSIDMEIA